MCIICVLKYIKNIFSSSFIKNKNTCKDYLNKWMVNYDPENINGA